MEEPRCVLPHASLTLISVPVYPSRIVRVGLDNAGKLGDADACGRSASFVCGCVVAIELAIRDERIAAVGFTTNGCGYMAACAQTFAASIEGAGLTDLHGLDDAALEGLITESLRDLPEGRVHCLAVTQEALHAAFAELRRQRVESFEGEAVLVCSCFGVTEETIEDAIAASRSTSVDEVTNVTRAGGGCGSCRMLIQEMLDAASL